MDSLKGNKVSAEIGIQVPKTIYWVRVKDTTPIAEKDNVPKHNIKYFATFLNWFNLTKLFTVWIQLNWSKQVNWCSSSVGCLEGRVKEKTVFTYVSWICKVIEIESSCSRIKFLRKQNKWTLGVVFINVPLLFLGAL